MVTDTQVRKLMKEIVKNGRIGESSLRAGMSRKTGSKYLKLGKYPSETKEPRTWQTRPDPFEADWPELAKRLLDAPELEAKALFEDLLEGHPERYHPGQVRTFQRRVRQWRATEGPDKEVFFPQEHRPGEALQTDFTWATELGVTIGGEDFPHMLCHPVLPYSNWEWATVCRSESLAALKRGVQAAIYKLGLIPKNHQTDNSTAATHSLTTGKREFNDDYLKFVKHFGMHARTIAVGRKEQNGDVESLNGALKRRIKQHLLLRGSSDFESVEAYEAWLHQVLEKANGLRTKRFEEEKTAMKPLKVSRLPEFIEEDHRVSSWSTINVKRNIYSVPSRLIGETVKVRLYEDRLKIYYGGRVQLSIERLLGRRNHRINYRHVIWSLVRKPGAFQRYRYQEDLFPSLVFRKAYDALCQGTEEYKADREYLRILHLAASTMESEVEAALEILLEEGHLKSMVQVKSLLDPPLGHQEIKMSAYRVDLEDYDHLLEIKLKTKKEVVL